MRKELLSWFERERLLLSDVVTASQDPENNEIKVILKAPVLALSRASCDFRECPDPVLFGYAASSLELMELEDMHQFVYQWFEHAVEAGMGRCFVCNKVLDMGPERPWDAVFVTEQLYCWLLVHYDCKRYLNRDIKGRNPFEVATQPPEFFDMRLT
jgi:hypothetical protein